MVFFRSKSKGVTLVELSIVLAIFGILIIVGISGRSLIDISRTNATMQYLNNRSIAFETFATTYSCLPGDCALVPVQSQLGTTGLGNGNTKIELVSEETRNELAFVEEHFVKAQLFNRTIGEITYSADIAAVPANGPTPATAASITEQGATENKLAGILPMVKIPSTYVSTFTIAGENYNILGAASATENVVNGTAVAYPNLFRIIDSKLDDGVATTGIARCETAGITATTTAFAGTSAYSAITGCVLAIKI